MSREEGNPIAAGAAMIRAASTGDTDAVRALLAEGADVDQRGRGAQTALMVAAMFNRVEIARLLLAAGASQRLRDNLGLTAREWAERRGSWEVAQLISKPGAVATRSSTEASPRQVDNAANPLSEPGAVATGSSIEATPREVDHAATSLPSAGTTRHQVEAASHAPETEATIAQRPDNLRWKKFHRQIMALQERRNAEESRHEADPAILSEPGAVATGSSTEAAPPQVDNAATLSEPRAAATEFSTAAAPPQVDNAATALSEPRAVATGSSTGPTSHHVDATALSEPGAVATWSAIPTTHREAESRPPASIEPTIAPPQDAPSTAIEQTIPNSQQEPRPTVTQLARMATTIEHLKTLEDVDEGEAVVRADVPPATPIHEEFPNEPVRRPQTSISAAAYPLGLNVGYSEPDMTLERVPVQSFTRQSIDEPKASESHYSQSLKRCPKCDASYDDPLLAYCAYDATKLVSAHDPVPGPTVTATATDDRLSPTLWALVAVVAVLGAFLGYLITDYRSMENATAELSRAQTEQPPVTAKKNSPVIEGALSGMEVNVPEPEYPAQARAEGVSGTVTVRVQVNEKGRVVLARSSRGDLRLRAAAVAAAQKATFSPEKLAVHGRVLSGTITYNFVAQTETPAATGSPLPAQTDSPSANGASPATGSSAANVGGDPQVGGPLVGAQSNLPQPDYPETARSRGIGGAITVVVRVNRAGKVISWRTSSGDSQLRAAALKAARKATFSPEKLPGTGEVVGTITYNFKP